MESRQLSPLRPARRLSMGSSTKSCAAASSNPSQKRSFSPRSISCSLRAPTASYWAAQKLACSSVSRMLASLHSTRLKYMLRRRSILRFATMSSHSYYNSDLAWVHHVGYSHHAEQTGPGVVALLREGGLAPGASVLDVGCGSGLLVRQLRAAGFAVHGVDASPAMIELARNY